MQQRDVYGRYPRTPQASAPSMLGEDRHGFCYRTAQYRQCAPALASIYQPVFKIKQDCLFAYVQRFAPCENISKSATGFYFGLFPSWLLKSLQCSPVKKGADALPPCLNVMTTCFPARVSEGAAQRAPKKRARPSRQKAGQRKMASLPLDFTLIILFSVKYLDNQHHQAIVLHSRASWFHT